MTGVHILKTLFLLIDAFVTPFEKTFAHSREIEFSMRCKNRHVHISRLFSYGPYIAQRICCQPDMKLQEFITRSLSAISHKFGIWQAYPLLLKSSQLRTRDLIQRDKVALRHILYHA